MSAGCSREPTVRKLKRDLYEARVRIDALDSFARRAGVIITNIAVSYSLVPEKEELLPLAEEYFKLFPPVDDSMEF